MDKINLITDENPFRIIDASVLAPGIGGSDDWYGACSVETFAGGVGGLTYTHEDAEGFLDYPTKFRNANFWYKDAQVRPWLYGEEFDNWQDTVGADAVTAFYHSGHGGMDNNGVFSIPTGGVFGGTSWATSNQMFLGNEEARYIFFSTCLSCRVLGGHTPVRTWWNQCKGFRMLFGFETVSVDHPGYGKFFWEEWKAGKSLTQAWLDASWRISHHQAPSVVAVGANQAEAAARLNSERFLNRGAAAKGWMQWKWYFAAAANQAMTANLDRPAQLTRLEFAPVADRFADVQRMAYELGFTSKDFDQMAIDPVGNFVVQAGDDRRLVINPGGRHEFQLKTINMENRDAIDPEKARAVAEDLIRSLDLNKSLTFDSYRVGQTAGGTDEGSGRIDATYATDVAVLFRPVIEGVTNVNHDHGNLLVTVDNDGDLVSIRNATRAVANVRAVAPGPREAGVNLANLDLEKELRTGLKEQRYGRHKATLLTDTVRVGYDYAGQTGDMVVQGTFEVDFGQNMRKLVEVRVPLGV